MSYLRKDLINSKWYITNNTLYNIINNAILPYNDKFYILNDINKIQQKENCIPALPQYDCIINNNIKVDTKKNYINYDESHDKYYTDGSNISNPGKGGYAYIQLNDIPLFHKNYNNIILNDLKDYNFNFSFKPYPTTITLNEGFAIILLLEDILKQKQIIKPIKKYMYIHVDNESILRLIGGKSFPKYNNIRNIIQHIFKLSNKI